MATATPNHHRLLRLQWCSTSSGSGLATTRRVPDGRGQLRAGTIAERSTRNSAQDITLRGLKALKSCTKIFLESYTSVLTVPKEQLEAA